MSTCIYFEDMANISFQFVKNNIHLDRKPLSTQTDQFLYTLCLIALHTAKVTSNKPLSPSQILEVSTAKL